MPRRKQRVIDFVPEHHEFGTGKKKSIITLSELEAMRLVDFEELSQVEAAEAMQVSRTTIQRLLQTGRKKLVSSLMYKEKIILKAQEKTEGKNAKLALINCEGTVGGHLGHAKWITLYDLKSGFSTCTSPEVTGGKARVKWLYDAGAIGVVVNKMGERAYLNLAELGIDVFDGTDLLIEDAIAAFNNETLQLFGLEKVDKKPSMNQVIVTEE